VGGAQGESIARSLISLTPPVERALLIGAPLKRSVDRHQIDEHLEELARLADTAGAVVVGELTQRLDRPDPATYLGKGKIEELRQLVDAENASLLIFDDELTPAQGRNVEEATGRRVMDRAELILDIFATRARTSEAKLQVELAQLEYLLPRLTRMWAHLEGQRGGIGMRGPGETQLETDRRLISQRLRLLKDRLVDVERARTVQRQSRRNAFKVSLVGYTNAGKSSIMRALSGADDILVEDRLFATLDPLTREIELEGNTRMLLTDTVGFIRKLPHNLVASFRATLEEATETDILVHVIDASHPGWEDQKVVVEQVLAEIGVADKPVILAFNKMDMVPSASRAPFMERVRNLLPGAVFVSVKDDHLGELRGALVASVRKSRPVTEITLSATDGKLLAELHRDAEVLGVRNEGVNVVVEARLDHALAGRLRRAGARVSQR
jgi:GTPase